MEGRRGRGKGRREGNDREGRGGTGRDRGGKEGGRGGMGGVRRGGALDMGSAPSLESSSGSAPGEISGKNRPIKPKPGKKPINF